MIYRTIFFVTVWLSTPFLMLAQPMDSSLVSSVFFTDSKFNNNHAGSGFFVRYKETVYGCTAKHVLLFAKTDHMQAVSFNESLKAWQFNGTKSGKNIRSNILVNEDSTQKIADFAQSDWLIFEIEENIPDEMFVFTLRETPLQKNEKLTFMGTPYSSEKPIRIDGIFLGLTESGNIRMDVPKGVYNGCSGGPVFDKNGLLVGLVSMGFFNEKTQKMVFEPASTEYFKSVIENL